MWTRCVWDPLYYTSVYIRFVCIQRIFTFSVLANPSLGSWVTYVQIPVQFASFNLAHPLHILDVIVPLLQLLPQNLEAEVAAIQEDVPHAKVTFL